MTRRSLKDNCPEGYSLYSGSAIDMLDNKELWRIFSHHPEPHLTRLPQDLVDVGDRPCAGRVPENWGKCIYYKVV